MITVLFIAVFVIAAICVFFGSKAGVSLANLAWKTMKYSLYLLGLLVLIGCIASFSADEETRPSPKLDVESGSVPVDLNQTP